eukprot:scaffold145130_cov33-Prasinocladus_malaysianus.AAC.1
MYVMLDNIRLSNIRTERPHKEPKKHTFGTPPILRLSSLALALMYRSLHWACRTPRDTGSTSAMKSRAAAWGAEPSLQGQTRIEA